MYRDVDGSEGFIGKFLTTYAKMKYGPGPDNVYAIINEKKQHEKKVPFSPYKLFYILGRMFDFFRTTRTAAEWSW